MDFKLKQIKSFAECLPQIKEHYNRNCKQLVDNLNSSFKKKLEFLTVCLRENNKLSEKDVENLEKEFSLLTEIQNLRKNHLQEHLITADFFMETICNQLK